MKKLRAASLSPNTGLPLREIVVYAPRRWDQMTASERNVVERVHMLLAAGRLIQKFHQRDDGSWTIRPFRQQVELEDDDDGVYRRKKRPHEWWPPNAPGYVTGDGGTHRRLAGGWWTVCVAAYTPREAYHLAALGEWAPDAFTPGIRRMFSDDGAIVLKPG